MGVLSALRAALASDDEHEASAERAAAAKDARCLRVDRLASRRRGRATGILRSVVLRPRSGVPAVEAELYDGTGALDLIWIGRRSIRGIEPGRRLRVEGMVTDVHGRRAIYNPRYDLLPRPVD